MLFGTTMLKLLGRFGTMFGIIWRLLKIFGTCDRLLGIFGRLELAGRLLVKMSLNADTEWT